MKKLLITICLAGTAALAVAPSGLAATHLSQSWHLHKTAQHGAVVIDVGAVRGAPLGPGTVRLTTTAHANGTVSFTFRELLAHGSVSGQGQLTYRFTPRHDKVLYRGVGRFGRGSGRDARVAGAFTLTGTGYPNATTTIAISAA